MTISRALLIGLLKYATLAIYNVINNLEYPTEKE